jgi:N-ethylmaleimide reductase
LIANVRMDAERGNRLITEGLADPAAFGRPFIANPNLVERFKTGAPLADINRPPSMRPGPPARSASD